MRRLYVFAVVIISSLFVCLVINSRNDDGDSATLPNSTLHVDQRRRNDGEEDHASLSLTSMQHEPRRMAVVVDLGRSKDAIWGFEQFELIPILHARSILFPSWFLSQYGIPVGYDIPIPPRRRRVLRRGDGGHRGGDGTDVEPLYVVEPPYQLYNSSHVSSGAAGRNGGEIGVGDGHARVNRWFNEWDGYFTSEGSKPRWAVPAVNSSEFRSDMGIDFKQAGGSSTCGPMTCYGKARGVHNMSGTKVYCDGLNRALLQHYFNGADCVGYGSAAQSIEPTDTMCGYHTSDVVKKLAQQGVRVELSDEGRGAATSRDAVVALAEGKDWHTFPASWATEWSIPEPLCDHSKVQGWPNMYHSCGSHNGMHWIVTGKSKHSSQYGLPPQRSQTWLVQQCGNRGSDSDGQGVGAKAAMSRMGVDLILKLPFANATDDSHAVKWLPKECAPLGQFPTRKSPTEHKAECFLVYAPIDDIACLGEYSEVIEVPPIADMKLAAVLLPGFENVVLRALRKLSGGGKWRIPTPLQPKRQKHCPERVRVVNIHTGKNNFGIEAELLKQALVDNNCEKEEGDKKRAAPGSAEPPSAAVALCGWQGDRIIQTDYYNNIKFDNDTEAAAENPVPTSSLTVFGKWLTRSATRADVGLSLLKRFSPGVPFGPNRAVSGDGATDVLGTIERVITSVRSRIWSQAPTMEVGDTGLWIDPPLYERPLIRSSVRAFVEFVMYFGPGVELRDVPQVVGARKRSRCIGGRSTAVGQQWRERLRKRWEEEGEATIVPQWLQHPDTQRTHHTELITEDFRPYYELLEKEKKREGNDHSSASNDSIPANGPPRTPLTSFPQHITSRPSQLRPTTSHKQHADGGSNNNNNTGVGGGGGTMAYIIFVDDKQKYQQEIYAFAYPSWHYVTRHLMQGAIRDTDIGHHHGGRSSSSSSSEGTTGSLLYSSNSQDSSAILAPFGSESVYRVGPQPGDWDRIDLILYVAPNAFFSMARVLSHCHLAIHQEMMSSTDAHFRRELKEFEAVNGSRLHTGRSAEGAQLARLVAEQLAQRDEFKSGVCVLIPTDLSQSVFRSEPLNYKFQASINIVTLPQTRHLLLQYDKILRSDGDTFLGPYLRRFHAAAAVPRESQQPSPDDGADPSSPSYRAVFFGLGSYARMPWTWTRIREHSARMGLRHHGMRNFGEAWFSEPELMMRATPIVNAVAEQLLKRGKNELMKWSQWWPGVTSMVATEIAVNHLVEPCDVGSDKMRDVDRGFMDVPSSLAKNRDWIGTHTALIHCWWPRSWFDKNDFHKKRYDFRDRKFELNELRRGESGDGTGLQEPKRYAAFIVMHYARLVTKTFTTINSSSSSGPEQQFGDNNKQSTAALPTTNSAASEQGPKLPHPPTIVDDDTREWRRRDMEYRKSLPIEMRRKWPARNRTCYERLPHKWEIDELRQRQQKGSPHLEWSISFCRAVPTIRKNTSEKNMSHDLYQQLKCIQQGLDEIGIPGYATGGTMVGLLTVNGMNMYEVDNDVVVPSWFNFERLQDYWSDLPETDVCRGMIIFAPEGSKTAPNMYRACMGIRDRHTECGTGEGDQCSEYYRPYSDIYLPAQVWGELYMFDVADDNDIEKHAKKIGENNERYSWTHYYKERRDYSTGRQVTAYKDLFKGPEAIPRVSWQELQPLMTGRKRISRQQAYESHIFKNLLRRQQIGDEGSNNSINISILDPRIEEFACHHKYGYNKWKKFPVARMNKKILKPCNTVYAQQYEAHSKGDDTIPQYKVVG